MPELVRSITARLRKFVSDRRCAKRYTVRLSCRVEFAKSKSTMNGRQAATSIEGHTSDISADGVALILPAIRIGDRYLAGENLPLLLHLKLPAQTIEIHAVAVRYDAFADEDQGTGYQVGMRITKLGQEDRGHYVEYLAQLAQK